MIDFIDHINISVTDLEKSQDFFVKLLGFTIEAEGVLEGEWIDKVVNLQNVKAKYIRLVLPDSQTRLELIHYYNPVGEKDAKTGQANCIGFRHIALEVKGIEQLYKKLREAGVKIFSEIQVFNKTKKLCYFLGPDDIILELAEYRR